LLLEIINKYKNESMTAFGIKIVKLVSGALTIHIKEKGEV